MILLIAFFFFLIQPSIKPSIHNLKNKLKGVKEVSKEIYRIEIPIEAKDEFSKDIDSAKKSVQDLEKTANQAGKGVENLGNKSNSASKGVEQVGRSATRSERHVSKFQKVAQKSQSFLQKITGKRWNINLNAVDKASRVIRSVGRFASRAIDRTYQTTLRAINLGGRVIRGFSRALLSLPTMITVGLGVVGVGKLSSATVGSAMNFEDYGVSMNHWLDGDKKSADKLMDWMGKKADTTPFTSQDIFPAMTGSVSLAGNNPKEIKRLTSAAIDMASLTPGSTVEDAMQAIQNAKMGEMTMMKRFGFNLSKDDFDSMGWSGFVDEIENRFEGGALALSDTARGQLNTLKGYMQSQFRSMGEGILEPMKPRLQAVTKWLMDNEDKWGAWKKTVQNAGLQASEWVFSKLGSAFDHLRVNYLENEKFQKLDFEGKISFIMDDINQWWNSHGKPALDSWWQGTGKPWAQDLGSLIGEAMVKGIVTAVREGISATLGMWGDVGETIKENGLFSKKTGSSILGAAGGTALLAGGLSLLARPLLKMLGGLGKGIGGLWNKGKGIFTTVPDRGGGKPKGKKKPKGTTKGNEPKTRRERKQGKPKGTTNRPPKTKKPKGEGIFKKGAKGLKKGAKTLGKFGKKALGPLGFLGSVSAADKAISGAGDWAFGHKEGDLKVPGLFSNPFKMPERHTDTKQGALGKAWNWITGKGNDQPRKKMKPMNPIKNPIGSEKIASLFPDKFTGADKGSGGKGGGVASTLTSADTNINTGAINKNAQTLATWLAQASNWVVGAFQPLQGVGATIAHNSTSLNTWLAQSSNWVVGAFQPLQGTGATIAHNATALNTWLAQSSNWVVGAFQPLQGIGATIVQNSTVLNTWLAQSSNWIVGAFAPLQGAGEFINHNVTALSTWLAQSSNWVVGAFAPLQGSGEIINQNVFALSAWLAQASNWVVGAFAPLQGSGEIINQNVFALNTWLAQASNWVVGAFLPIQTLGQLTVHNLSALNTWLAQSSAWVVATFTGIQVHGQLVNHNLSALSTWLGQASNWVVGTFQPMQASGQMVSANLSALSTWVAQASNWVVGGIQPIQSNGSRVSGNLSILAGYAAKASGWVASINGIQSGANAVKSALSGLASRIRSTSVPKISAPKLPSFKIPKYAKGTSGHPFDGPAIVGDGGGSEMMQFPNGRMMLSPSTDTMMNLPKGTKVVPHQKTKKMMEVPGYADGVGKIDVGKPSGASTIVYGDTHNTVGETHVTVVVEGSDSNDPVATANAVADEVAGIIADKIEQVSGNMPVSGEV